MIPVNRAWKTVSCIIVCSLAACGGDDPQPETVAEPTVVEPELQDQTLVLERGLQIQANVGDTIENKVSSEGSGDFSFTSSDTHLATVSAEGLVTVLKPGEVTISISRDADAIFKAVTATYSITTKFQTTFELPNTTAILAGDSVTLNVTSNADLPINFVSKNTRVATVDDAGLLQSTTAGVATVTVSTPESDTFWAGSAEVVQHVFSPELHFEAWLGADSSQIYLPGDATGIELSSSSDFECALPVITECMNGKTQYFSGKSLLNDNFSRSQPALLNFKIGEHHASLAVTGQGFPFDTSHFEWVNFKNKMWVIGGNLSKKESQVWSSTDGKQWHLEKGNTEFGYRYMHGVVVFNDTLYVVGGSGLDEDENPIVYDDIWTSEDGINWVKRNVNPLPMLFDSSSKLVVHNDQLMILNSSENGIPGDVWASTDGITWKRIANNLEPLLRQWFQVVSFQDKLWVIAGRMLETFNDVWSSEDGVNWVKEVDNAAFPKRYFHHVIEHDEQLWLFGGRNADDVWVSSDAISWQLVKKQTPVFHTQNAALSFNSKLWAFRFNTANEMYSSKDGIDWQRETTRVPLKENRYQAIVGDTMYREAYKLGSSDSIIYQSQQGISWKETALSVNNHFDYDRLVLSQQSVFFEDNYWHSRDGKLYQSADGLNYEAVMDTNYTRYAGSLVIFKNELWSINDDRVGLANNPLSWREVAEVNFWGYRKSVVATDKYLFVFTDAGGFENNLYRSEDGIHWSLISSTPGSGNHFYQEAIVFKNKLWLVGSVTKLLTEDENAVIRMTSDVWSSIDGVTWVQEQAKLPFEMIYGGKLEVFKDRIMLFAGVKSRSNEVWSSIDGVNWDLGYTNQVNFK
ncbi:MAG: Ig-like domain-containing protein [Pseudomonadota bacterium]